MTGMTTTNIRHLRRPNGRHAAFERRWKTNWTAVLRIADAQIPCAVVDLSVAGAGVRFGMDVLEATHVSLIVQDREPISARIAWRRAGAAGLCFLRRQPWVVDLVIKTAAG